MKHEKNLYSFRPKIRTIYGVYPCKNLSQKFSCYCHFNGTETWHSRGLRVDLFERSRLGKLFIIFLKLSLSVIRFARIWKRQAATGRLLKVFRENPRNVPTTRKKGIKILMRRVHTLPVFKRILKIQQLFIQYSQKGNV